MLTCDAHFRQRGAALGQRDHQAPLTVGAGLLGRQQRLALQAGQAGKEKRAADVMQAARHSAQRLHGSLHPSSPESVGGAPMVLPAGQPA